MKASTYTRAEQLIPLLEQIQGIVLDPAAFEGLISDAEAIALVVDLERFAGHVENLKKGLNYATHRASEQPPAKT